MDEQQPLLRDATLENVEAGGSGDAGSEKGHIARWREYTAETLECRPWHYIVIILVLTDSVCVLADLGYTVLSDTCTPPEGPEAPLWLNVLSHLSLAITTLFLVEIPVTLWAMGFKFYNPLGPIPHAGLHLFDSLIIVVTFILEIVLRGRERELAGLLIILRLWRLVKLVGGIAVSAGELEEENANILARTRQERDNALKELDAAQREIRSLRSRITWSDSDTVAG